MVYGSERWEMNVDQSARLEWTEMRMVRWMCGASLRDRVLMCRVKGENVD